MDDDVDGSGRIDDGALGRPDGAAVALDARWERPGVGAVGGEATLLVRVVAQRQPARRAPVDVALVIDRSGSMAGEPIRLAKQAVGLAVGRLGEVDRAALVAYDDRIEVLRELAPATARGKAALRLALAAVDARGTTDLGRGWLTGTKLLGAAGGDDGRVRRVVLLSDGLANVGITDPAELTFHAGEVRKLGVGTTTLGLGLEFDEVLLAGMAEQGGGNFQFVAAPGRLGAFFERELRELTSMVALGTTVTLALPDGVVADLVTAFPVDRHARHLAVAAGDVAAGDAFDFVFALRFPDGEPGTSFRCRAVATWIEPGTGAIGETEQAPPPLRSLPVADLARLPIDPFVAERAAVQRAAAERREGLRLDRAGHRSAARDRMRSAAMLLRAAPPTDAVAFDLHQTERLAAAAAPYHETEQKHAAWQNALRRRNRRDDQGTVGP